MNQRTRTSRTRPSLQRVMAIHRRIQAGAHPNCVGLAAALEVSVPTLKRDIEFMRDRLGLPIEYDGCRHGYHYSQPVDRFPLATVSEAEMFALLVADKAIAQYQGTPFQRPLRMAFSKLSAQLDGRDCYALDDLHQALSFRPFAPEDADLRVFQILTQALRQRRTLRFRYRNLGTRGARPRLVHPYHLACIDNHWYLFAFDLDRQAVRTFALARLAQPELLRQRFPRPRHFDPDEYLRGSFTVLKGEHDYEVVIEFDNWATDLVRGRIWHASQQFTELPAGTSRLRLRLSGLEEIERWVLSWGTHACVLRPQILADRVAATARAISAQYERHDSASSHC
jgi:predicted DNA-binding transcriptional regulator YafY